MALSNLRPGAHQMRLQKVTESIGILGAFPGFYGQPGTTVGGASQSRRQIEFIGDSLGFGNTDFATPLRPDRPWKTRDALIDTVIAAMTAFVKTLYASNPATPFVIIWPEGGTLAQTKRPAFIVTAKAIQDNPHNGVA